VAVLLLGATAQTGWAQEARALSLWDLQAKALAELDETSIIFEVNSTDGDAGAQVFVDGEGWKKVWVFNPNGRRILSVQAQSSVKAIGGGTELFLESEEPEYANLDELQELLDLFPEGDYTFFAQTVEGGWAMGEAELTYDIPAGPVIAEPTPDEGEECAADVFVNTAVIEWDEVEESIFGSPDIDIVGYQVIVEIEEPVLRVFSADVPADTLMVMVPPEFLEEGAEFKFEILAIEESGNQTITESCFETAE
jgi:hypothetical protein